MELYVTKQLKKDVTKFKEKKNSDNNILNLLLGKKTREAKPFDWSYPRYRTSYQNLRSSLALTNVYSVSARINADSGVVSRIRHSMENKAKHLTDMMDGMDLIGDKDKHYRQFKIPKKKGGYRQITAPQQQLKEVQAHTKWYIENNLKWLPHDSAHAYTAQRGIRTNANYHRDSRFFLNIDLKDFFDSINHETITKFMAKVYPFCMSPNFSSVVATLATYKDQLPQGTPLSPLLTNILCVPLDFHINAALYKMYKDGILKARVLYTRYSDDMTFSSAHNFDQNNIIEVLGATMNHIGYPFTIHPDKIRFTTNKGKNRVTGIKVNAKNKISIGYKEKEGIKRDLHNILRDYRNGEFIDGQYITHVIGMLAFLHDIEPGYYQFLNGKYGKQYRRVFGKRVSLIDYLNYILNK